MNEQENTIKVSKIEIKIGKQVISLTPDELKELKDVLEKTFPSEKIQWIPSQPIYVPWTSPYIGTPVQPYNPWQPMWTVTCESPLGDNHNGQTMCLKLNGGIQ